MIDELLDSLDSSDLPEQVSDTNLPQDIDDYFSNDGFSDTPFLGYEPSLFPIPTESIINTDNFGSFEIHSTVEIENYVNTNPMSENTDVSFEGLHNSYEIKVEETGFDLRSDYISVNNSPLSVNNTPLSVDTSDPALDSLLHETNVAIQDARDFSLPDDMIINAVNVASDFWHIPHPAIMHSETTCEIPGNPTTYADDVIGICRQQMIEMGVYGEDAMGLVATHETFHRVLQNYSAHGVLDSWEHELACDFAAGIRAGYQNMDVTHFENSLINTPGGETHPVGTLRVDFIEYAKHIGEQMREDGVQPNFENCIAAFNHHLIEEDSLIAQYREAVSHNGLVAEQVNDGQVSFTGKHTDAEISKLRENLRNSENEVSNLRSSVHSHENRVNNADTTKGHENGSYKQEVAELNTAKSKLSSAISKRDGDKSKLNNAL